jgi:hypothetical protein
MSIVTTPPTLNYGTMLPEIISRPDDKPRPTDKDKLNRAASQPSSTKRPQTRFSQCFWQFSWQ